MNTLKKIGLTALGTSLVAGSAYAGEITASGDAGYTWSSEDVGETKAVNEGYEVAIIKELAKVLPKNFQLFIIFENFKNDLDMSFIKAKFQRNIKIYKIQRNNPWKEKWPDFIKGILMILNRKIITKIIEPDNINWSVHIIMHIK